jgi:very-short-patch-repair endonuclease
MACQCCAMTLDERANTVLLGIQRQVLSWEQAFASGVTPSGVQHRIRQGGPWQRLLPGVYLTTSGAPTREQLAVAALLYAGPGSLLTGAEALRTYRMHAPDLRQMEVLVPASRQTASRDHVVIHRTQRMPASSACFGFLRLAPEARAVADAARSLQSLPEVRAVVAGAVQQRRCRIEDLAAELREGPIRGSARLRKVLQEVVEGIRSPAEADFRRLIISSRLPRPLFNPDLYLGGQFLARPDAWWPDAGVAVEIDSRRWHLGPDEFEETMRRHARMGAVGIVVLHFSPHQLRTEPDRVLRDIACALQAGRRLSGIETRLAA